MNEITVFVGDKQKTHILEEVNSVCHDCYYETNCEEIGSVMSMVPSKVAKQKLIGNSDVCEKCIIKNIKQWNR